VGTRGHGAANTARLRSYRAASLVHTPVLDSGCPYKYVSLAGAHPPVSTGRHDAPKWNGPLVLSLQTQKETDPCRPVSTFHPPPTPRHSRSKPFVRPPMGECRLRLSYCLDCSADIRMLREWALLTDRPGACPICGSEEILSELRRERQTENPLASTENNPSGRGQAYGLVAIQS
jgi:hypothetical protein